MSDTQLAEPIKNGNPVPNSDGIIGVDPTTTPCGMPGRPCTHSLDGGSDEFNLLLEAWRGYAEQGLVVFPTRPPSPSGKYDGKHPVEKWQTEWLAVGRSPFPHLASMNRVRMEPGWGLWMATGQVSKRVSLDIDKPEAEKHWRELIGPEIYDRAYRVNSSVRDGFQRYHLDFRIRPDDDRPWPGHSDSTYDFRGDGGGVKMPPSVHPKDDVRYEYVGGELLEAPGCLWRPDKGHDENHPSGELKVHNGIDPIDPDAIRELEKYLDQIRQLQDGGCDTGFVKYAYWPARAVRGGVLPEEYVWDRIGGAVSESDMELDHAANKWEYLLGRAEKAPLKWIPGGAVTLHTQTRVEDGAEQPKNVDTPIKDYRRCGYLVKGPNRINNYPHLVSQKTEDGPVMKMADGKAWSNFDMEALGIYVRDDEVEAYLVRVTVEETGTTSGSVVLPIEVLSDSRKLRLWLSKRHAAVDRVGRLSSEEPSAAMPNEVRLQKYLDAQNPPVLRLVDYVGWQSEHDLFLTPTGIIRPGMEGIQSFTAVSPSGFAVENSRCNYGTEVSTDEAVDIFKQFLTFHEETVASVVGSWLVMLVLRGQYSASMFPYLHVEGLAESSKTHFLRMGLQLVGQTHKGGTYSLAAAENNYGCHTNGVIWIDDNDGLPEPVQALVRQAATGGESAKMRADDFSKTRKMEFRAATVISSEGLTKRFNDQKANRDRAIRLKFPKVVDRVSKIDPNRLQWADIRELWMDRWGTDFTRVAGSLVAAILALAAEVEIPAVAKRTHQNLAIVQAGAKILSKLTEDSEHQVRVDKWAADQVENDLGNASLVTLEVIPAVWCHELFPKSYNGNGVAVAVYRDESSGTFNVNARKLAARWLEINRGSSGRTESLTDETAITRELDAIGAGKSTSRKTGLSKAQGESVLRYREIPATYAKIIDEAARG